MFKRTILTLLAIAALCIPARADLQGALPIIVVNASTPTTCQTVTGAHSLLAVWNAATTAQTITVTFYNDTTCTTADAFAKAIALPAAGASGSILTFPSYTRSLVALSYQLSAAATANIIILPGN